MRWLLLLLLLGCSDPPSAPSVAPVVAPAPPPEGIWGVPAYDTLADLTRPAEALVDRPAGRTLARALTAAADIEPPDSLSPEARIALQNDAWGLWQRIQDLGVSSQNAEALERGTARLVAQLALEAPDAWRPGFPPAVAPVLGRGWTELESELPSLQHERMYGIRRVFHLARRGENERVLFSTLVAIDRQGGLHVTSVPGEVEMLRFEDDELMQARVLELDRRALRQRGVNHALREVQEIAHIPTTGANRFYAVFDPPEALDPPAPLTSPPCVRCHDDAQTMSLPTPAFAVGDRYDDLLRTAVRPLIDADRD